MGCGNPRQRKAGTFEEKKAAIEQKIDEIEQKIAATDDPQITKSLQNKKSAYNARLSKLVLEKQTFDKLNEAKKKGAILDVRFKRFFEICREDLTDDEYEKLIEKLDKLVNQKNVERKVKNVAKKMN